jgi:hypothetical protein
MNSVAEVSRSGERLIASQSRGLPMVDVLPPSDVLPDIDAFVAKLQGDDARGGDPTASAQFAAFTQTGNQGNPPNQGLSIPDIYSEPQRIYERYLKDNASRTRANYLRDIRRARLVRHIRDNILYYCRAIWAEEDADQRLLRYAKENRRVPLVWEGPTGNLLDAPTIFIPYYSGRVVDWIDPMGPVGFHANCSVYSLRPVSQDEADLLISDKEQREANENDNSYLVSIIDLLSVMAAPYLDSSGMLLDPALRLFRDPNDQRNAYVRDPNLLTRPSDDLVGDIVSYLPRLQGDPAGPSVISDRQGRPIRDPRDLGPVPKLLLHPISTDDFGEYLYRKNGTRRFLVDTNSPLVDILPGTGSALEPYKRLHRFADALSAYEELISARLKNLRRGALLNEKGEFDPDIAKVVIVGGSSTDAVASSEAAVTRAEPLTGSTPAMSAPVEANDHAPSG